MGMGFASACTRVQSARSIWVATAIYPAAATRILVQVDLLSFQFQSVFKYVTLGSSAQVTGKAPTMPWRQAE